MSTAEVLEQSYLDVEKLLYHTVNCFMRNVGTAYGSQEELMCIANHEFMVAHRDYKKARGTKFTGWVRRVVMCGLLEHQRNVTRRQNIKRIDYVDDMMPYDQPVGSSNFDMLVFCDELSSDAQYVVQLTVNTPKSLCLCLQEKRNNTPETFLRVISDFLEGRGWTSEQIQSAYEEVTNAVRRSVEQDT